MSLQRVGRLVEQRRRRSICSPDPAVQERPAKPLAWLLPELPQLFLGVTGCCRLRLVQLQGLLVAGILGALGIEIFRSLQDKPLHTLEVLLLLSVLLVVQRPPQLRELFVEKLDDVEVIEDDLLFGKVDRDRLPVGPRHVLHRHDHDLDLALSRSLPEGLERTGALAVTNEDHRPGLEVQLDPQVAVCLCDSDLIDGDLSKMLQFGLGETTTQLALLDVLDRAPADSQVAGHIADGPVTAQSQNKTLE